MIPSILRKAAFAVLVDKFHLTLDEIRNLTDRQIEEIYFHPRDETGAIIFPAQKAPQEAASLESDLRAVDMLAGNIPFTAKEIAEAKEKIRAKYGAI